VVQNQPVDLWGWKYRWPLSNDGSVLFSVTINGRKFYKLEKWHWGYIVSSPASDPLLNFQARNPLIKSFAQARFLLPLFRLWKIFKNCGATLARWEAHSFSKQGSLSQMLHSNLGFCLIWFFLLALSLYLRLSIQPNGNDYSLSSCIHSVNVTDVHI